MGRERHPLSPKAATVRHRSRLRDESRSGPDAERDDALDDPVDLGGRPRKLTPGEWARIIRLHQRGASTRVIAAHLSRGRRTVSKNTVARFLRDVRESNEDVRLSLAAFRRDAVESWHKAMQYGAKYGRHAPAKDWLIATGTITREESIDRVVILVGDGTAPVAKLPDVPDDIDVVATTVHPDPAPDAASQAFTPAEWPFAGPLILPPSPKPSEP
jgi:Homeodomain-like domain